MYKNNKALYEMDNDPAGFEWINADDIFRSIYSFVRHSKNKEKNLLFVCNFTPVEREDYRVGVPTRKTLKLVLNSDEEKVRRKRGKTSAYLQTGEKGMRRSGVFDRIPASGLWCGSV